MCPNTGAVFPLASSPRFSLLCEISRPSAKAEPHWPFQCWGFALRFPARHCCQCSSIVRGDAPSSRWHLNPPVTPFCWKYGAQTLTEPPGFSLANPKRSPVCKRYSAFGTPHCDTCDQPFEIVPCSSCLVIWKIYLPEVQVPLVLLPKLSRKWRSAVILVKQGKLKKAARINTIIKINGKMTREFTDLRSASSRDS